MAATFEIETFLYRLVGPSWTPYTSCLPRGNDQQLALLQQVIKHCVLTLTDGGFLPV